MTGLHLGDPVDGFACRPVRWTLPALNAPTVWQALGDALAAADDDAAKLFLDGRPVPTRHWPDHRGTGRLPWSAGLDSSTGGYFAWARDAQLHHRALFETVVQAYAPVLAEQGLPSGAVESEIFFGDYECTPGGVHREACSNLHLVLSGSKTMHFWPVQGWPLQDTARRIAAAEGTATREEYLPELDPRHVLGAARSMTAAAGEGFAWAAGTWHVARTHGPALALNIAAYQGGLDPEPVQPLWGDRLHGPVPAEFMTDYRRHVGTTASDAALLCRLSAAGMRPAPAAATAEGPAGGRFRWRLNVPLVWAYTGDAVLVSALGAIRHLPARTPLDWLHAPRTAALAEVEPGAEALAGWLHRQGVLEPMEEQ
ncbi:hypothetical protein [Solwaraspora sp. WMMA2065]|uniref:hypothetical protein n=1 Tax=Solwaraspora sp. WMMA2065 TaxID=3015166 RepID=UPI00259BC238|nr:hypothetical protein [Solwaraspora sp. WMMA2065]WJK33075.1 hypothetical protein O7610_20435 [Solwaraspora sp. WMMA2065]